MSEIIKRALKDVETAENNKSEEACDYFIRKAQVLALIAIAEQMQRANELKNIENDIRNRAMWKMK